jgi:lysophospholipid acyltransferase
VKLIGSFLLSYPLAAILKRLPDKDPWKKNVFIITVSLFYMIGLYELWDGLRTILYSSVATYVIAYYVDGSLMPWIGFFFLMGHMSISHIYRQMLDDPTVVDITGPQMVLVMKLSAFCWNIHDGRLPQAQLTDAQKYAAITEFPSVLDYAGYVLFFPSLFGGPAFDYIDYRRWIDTTLFDVPPGTDPSKVPPTRKKRRIPRSGRPATKKLAMGLFWILAFLQLSGMYPAELVLNDDYMQYSLLRRIWYMHMIGFVTRLKYYGAWALTEGACILSGLGYNGFDPKTGKVFWDRLENVNPWGLETAQNTRGYIENWNKNTNHWLRNYIYLRVTPKGRKPGFRASMATFVTSAFWHGFYPGYYLTFVLASLIQTVAKSMFIVSFSFLSSYRKVELIIFVSPRLPSTRSSLFPHPRRHQTDCCETLL